MDCLKYYLVTAKCGHVGRSKYIPIIFPVAAYSKKEAARITRNLPRVKHDHKDAIINVTEVNYQEFKQKSIDNKKDGYLLSKNKMEQILNCVDLYDRLMEDHYNSYKEHDVEERINRIRYKKKKKKYL